MQQIREYIDFSKSFRSIEQFWELDRSIVIVICHYASSVNAIFGTCRYSTSPWTVSCLRKKEETIVHLHGEESTPRYEQIFAALLLSVVFKCHESREFFTELQDNVGILRKYLSHDQ